MARKAGRIERKRPPFAQRPWLFNGDAMHDRIVTTPDAARAGTKEGLVRYVLATSLALVVILFIVGYLAA